MRDKFIFMPSKEVPATHQALLQETLKILSDDKVAQKKAESDAIGKMTTDISGTDKHTVLWNYEKAHLNAGADWEQTKLKLRSKHNGDPNLAILITDFWDKENNRGTAQIEGLVKISNNEVIHKLGTVFLGDARFTDLRPQPKGLLNKVYVLGRIVQGTSGAKLEQDPDHTKSHFVWLPKSQTYVRRFVTRGLNHNDIINISKGANLGAPVQTIAAQKRETTSTDSKRFSVREGVNLSESAQILSHARGWQKRYISTGVSNHPVFSTRGTQFMSLFGTAVIDLAKVNLSEVFDIHSPIAVQNLLGWNATAVTTATGPGNSASSINGEKFLALRDVLRTRELLIKFQVPHSAINCLNDGQRIVGLGCTRFNDPDELYSRAMKWPLAKDKITAHETTNYKGYNDRYWLFLLCRNFTDARWLFNNFNGYSDTTYLLLNRYVMPATLAGWK